MRCTDLHTAATRAIGCNRSARFHEAGGLEEHPAALADETVRADCAAVIDYRSHYADAPAVGEDLAEVGSGAVAAGDLHCNARCAAIHKLHGVTCSEDGLALGRVDDAVVCNLGSNEVDRAALRRGNGAFVLDGSGVGCGIEIKFARNKITVGQVKRGSNKPRNINVRARPHQNTGGIDKKHSAVRCQCAEQ